MKRKKEKMKKYYKRILIILVIVVIGFSNHMSTMRTVHAVEDEEKSLVEEGTWLGMPYVITAEDGEYVCYLTGEQAYVNSEDELPAYSFIDSNAPYYINRENYLVSKVICDAILQWDAVNLFANCSNLKTIEFTDNCKENTKFTLTGNMLNGCSSLTAIDLSGIVFSTRDFHKMFEDCTSLINVNFDNAIISIPIKDFSMMFARCYALEYVDLSSIDFSEVETMKGMLGDCSSLKNVIFPDSEEGVFLVPNGGVDQLFAGDKQLESVDLSCFDFSEITAVESMWSSTHIQTIDTPLNVECDIPLVNGDQINAVYIDENGNEYTSLPMNLDYSIRLTSKEPREELKEEQEETSFDESNIPNNNANETVSQESNQKENTIALKCVGIAGIVIVFAGVITCFILHNRKRKE